MPIVIQEKFKNTNKKKQSKGGGGMDIGSPKKTTTKKLGGSMYVRKTKPAVKGYKNGGKVAMPKPRPKKDPFRADKTESLDKKFSAGVSATNRKNMKNVKKKAGGGKLKSVPEGNKGLGKLPTPVRNKMGYMKKGGKVTKKTIKKGGK
tara:strand:+ start:171 stop:614 length:444 start_codon:yes stop_codon:yes gene_type:complete